MRFAPRLLWVLIAALLLPALPSVAATRLPEVVEPLLHTTALPVGESEAVVDARDELVGVTWAPGASAPEVQVRWHLPTGWTAWEAAEPDDAQTATERVGTVPGTEPLWRPAGADRVAVRVSGDAEGLSLVRVGDGAVRSGGWDLGLRGDAAHAADGRPYLGVVGSRADWGADERMRRGVPAYASAVRAVVVHHTAGSNDYRPEDVPAKIRADYAYHVRGRGWSDLGYNLVVDRFGRIWEGRAGGLGRATVGTHSAGFNTGTLGVSVLGDFTRTTPGPEVVNALSRVAAYAAATWDFDPRGRVDVTSGGSPRYAKGTRVSLPRIHGHSDTGRTECPGSVYDRLDEIRSTAAALLVPAPDFVHVDVSGTPVRAPEPVVVRAQLTRPVRWSAAIRDSAGQVMVRATGDSATPELRWDGRVPAAPLPAPPGSAPVASVPVPAPPGTYSWKVVVSDGVHTPALRTEQFEVGLPVAPPAP